MSWCTGTRVPVPGDRHARSCVPPALPIQTLWAQLCMLLAWGPGLKIGTESFVDFCGRQEVAQVWVEWSQLEPGARRSRGRKLISEAVGELQILTALQTFYPPLERGPFPSCLQGKRRINRKFLSHNNLPIRHKTYKKHIFWSNLGILPSV